jgi:ClpP class serine protease
MARADRVAAIKRIEEIRNHRVITYVTGDRFPIPAQMHDDALRPIYDQLRSIGKTESLDLFIYSRGGASDVPWRIANALRMTASKNWSVLIPFRANSAATLLALGADEIVLGRNGELGPIDPSLNLQRITKSPDGGQTMMQESVSVEDIMAYVKA